MLLSDPSKNDKLPLSEQRERQKLQRSSRRPSTGQAKVSSSYVGSRRQRISQARWQRTGTLHICPARVETCFFRFQRSKGCSYSGQCSDFSPRSVYMLSTATARISWSTCIVYLRKCLSYIYCCHGALLRAPPTQLTMAPLLSYPFLLCHHGEQTLENATTASARFSAAERFHLSESCPAAATASCFWRDALQRAFRLLLGRQGSHNLQENSQDHADGASIRSLSSLRIHLDSIWASDCHLVQNSRDVKRKTGRTSTCTACLAEWLSSRCSTCTSQIQRCRHGR